MSNRQLTGKNLHLKLVRDAKALIADKSRWTTGTYARDVTGRYCAPVSPKAVTFCALGALWKIAHDMGVSYSSNDLFPNFSISGTNDKQGHAAIMELFTQAEQRLEGEILKSLNK